MAGEPDSPGRPGRPGQTAECLVVMYHFVRDAERTPYPGIRARRVADFQGQVEFLCRHHQPLTMRDLLRFAAGECDLPAGGFYLTFDDGFRDHLDTVMPILQRAGLEGAFFPMTEPLVRGRVPSVEKLRFLIYNVDFPTVQAEFFGALGRLFPDVDASPWRYDDASAPRATKYARFDDPRVAHFKRAVTLEIPRQVRDAVLDTVFTRHFGPDADFIDELYMNWSELAELRAGGMVIGGHTVTHPWLPRLSAGEQGEQINVAWNQLERRLGRPLEVFAYPYGAFDTATLAILRRRGCRLAFTTHIGTSLDRRRPLQVDRLDTNDLPVSPADEPNAWSRQAGLRPALRP